MAFARPKTSSTRRGYDQQHKRIRAALLTQLNRAGSQPCAEPICVLRRPLYAHDPDGVALAHTPDRQAYRGLAHRTCNQREAASRGARISNARRQGQRVRDTSRAW